MEISHKKNVNVSLERQFTRAGQNSSFRVICGPMFSGKTKTLIQVINDYKSAGLHVTVFKPELDDRYSENAVISHDQDRITAVGVKHAVDILNYINNTDVIAIDEVQFFDEHILSVCQTIVENEKIVVVSGLDLDYKAQPFGSMPKILALADEIIKLNAICTFCEGHARYSHRISAEKDTIILGEKDKYVPLCRSCYKAVSKS